MPAPKTSSSRSRAGRKPDPSKPRSRYRPGGPGGARGGAPDTETSRTPAKPKVSRSKRNPFADRESAAAYVRDALDEYRRDYKDHKRQLEKGLRDIDVEIRRTRRDGGPTVSLYEGRAALISSLKTLQTNYTKFLLDITKQKDLLSNLDAPSAGSNGTIINIILPDLTAIPVVQVTGAPPEATTKTEEEAEDDAEIQLDDADE